MRLLSSLLQMPRDIDWGRLTFWSVLVLTVSGWGSIYLIDHLIPFAEPEPTAAELAERLAPVARVRLAEPGPDKAALQTEPESVPDAEPKADPAESSQSASPPEPVPSALLLPTPEPAPESAPESAPEPIPEPAPEPAAEPAASLAPPQLGLTPAPGRGWPGAYPPPYPSAQPPGAAYPYAYPYPPYPQPPAWGQGR
ncbi:MAG: hypothetical protein JXM75_00735 [Chromatiaceae bacterium]|nr:hypothetical protein [Chromatiaceae bacterium]